MKTKSKALLIALCAVLLVTASVLVTIAYLTSTDKAINTFTVGKVKITLDETKVDEYGEPEVGAARVKTNQYKLIPGHEYIKDPTVHVDSESEPCYIRIIVTVSEIEDLKNAFPVGKYPEFYHEDVFLLEKLVTGWDSDVWVPYSATAEGVYEFRYADIYTYVSPGDLPELFASVKIPGTVTGDNLSSLEEGFKTEIEAHAIQADGFANANAAWAAFDGQHNP
ncbi:MAG: hypothetical protein ACOYJD_09775 [Christensenellales bacterium]